ncbi:MAG: flagellar hook-associated protein FlgL [Actinomycetota bacterium]
MISRTTLSTTVRNFLADLNGNNRLLDQAQRQVSTGKRISTPADDAIGITTSLRLRSDRASNAAWQSNIQDSLTWLSTTDTALANALDVVQRARELTIQGSNGALSQTGRGVIADEVDQLAKQMVEVGNATLGGRYLFGGTKTQTPPFTSTGTYQGNTGNLTREVDLASTTAVNVTGDRLVGPGGSTPNIFTALTTLATDLRNNNTAGVQGALATLDAHMTNLNALRGEVGGKTNKLEMTLDRHSATDLASLDQISQVEDADMALAITQLQSRETVYRATLGVGGRVLPPSLIDFLK